MSVKVKVSYTEVKKWVPQELMDHLGVAAYPLTVNLGNGTTTWARGLTKREYFSALALQGMLSNPTVGDDHLLPSNAVRLADALISELEKPQAVTHPTPLEAAARKVVMAFDVGNIVPGSSVGDALLELAAALGEKP